MQIAGESLLNAADLQFEVKDNVVFRWILYILHDLVLPKPPCDQDGVAIVVWLVFYNLMKGRDHKGDTPTTAICPSYKTTITCNMFSTCSKLKCVFGTM